MNHPKNCGTSPCLECESVEKDIGTIEQLYPLDSQYPQTEEVARRLLIEAINKHDWRELPSEILSTYAELCKAEDKPFRSSTQRDREKGPGI